MKGSSSYQKFCFGTKIFQKKYFYKNNYFPLIFNKKLYSTNKPPVLPLDYQRPLVVVALGGNALLKRGEEINAEVQRKNIITACKRIGEILPTCDMVLTHGNGPQVGLLAHQSSSSLFPMPLDVIGAESVGMIGYLIEQEFRNIVKGKEIVTIVTQVEVDPNDPAFHNPTKPIGKRYTKEEKEQVKYDWKWKKENNSKEELYRRIVASPEPKDILEIKVVKRLIEVGTVVITCGGGGIPVIKNRNGVVQGIEAVIDKDKAAALLANCLGADVLIMLTDVEHVYLNWENPVKKKALVTVTPEELKQHKFEEGTMGPKVDAAIEFLQKGGKWSAIGSLDKLNLIMDGKDGTRIIDFKNKKNSIFIPYDTESLPSTWPPIWEERNILSWLNNVVEIPDYYISLLENKEHLKDPSKFLQMRQTDFEKIGIPWNMAQSLDSFLTSVRKRIGTANKDLGTRFISSSPYPWPYNGKLERDNTVIIVVDMQEDFCSKNGYLAKMGYPIDMTRAPIPFIQNLLSVARKKGLHIIHTREGHRENLVDLPDNKRWRCERLNVGIGSHNENEILVRGHKGWDTIDELKPLFEDTVIDKPGKSAFYSTDLEHMLKLRKIQNIIICGITTDVGVHTTMCEANDRGFECLLVEDACGSALKSSHRAVINSIHISGGIIGATATTCKVISTLSRLPDFNEI